VRPLHSLVGTDDGIDVTVRRISEPLQTDEKLMAQLRRAGVVPGQTVRARRDRAGVVVGAGGETVQLPTETAAHVFVNG
jgi:DtxR family transcriptional regulator, Mn-dependent transcriptional regulator